MSLFSSMLDSSDSPAPLATLLMRMQELVRDRNRFDGVPLSVGDYVKYTDDADDRKTASGKITQVDLSDNTYKVDIGVGEAWMRMNAVKKIDPNSQSSSASSTTDSSDVPRLVPRGGAPLRSRNSDSSAAASSSTAESLTRSPKKRSMTADESRRRLVEKIRSRIDDQICEAIEEGKTRATVQLDCDPNGSIAKMVLDSFREREFCVSAASSGSEQGEERGGGGGREFCISWEGDSV